MTHDPRVAANTPNAPAWLAGGGEMGARIRAFDWSRTGLGPPEAWSQSLCSALAMMLASKAQILVIWGRDFNLFYNDAYRSVLGVKHPGALGLPVSDPAAWGELWVTGHRELVAGVLATGEAYWASDSAYNLARFGYLEETFFNASYDPLRDETGRICGLFCIIAETTARVIGERQMMALRELVVQTPEAPSVGETCEYAARVLGGIPNDLSFGLIYLCDADATTARLAGSAGLAPGSCAAPLCVSLAPEGEASAWPLGAVLRANKPEVLTDLRARFGDLVGAAWPEPVHTAVVSPLGGPAGRVVGFLVAGVSPRRPLDGAYRAFLKLLAGQIAVAVGSASAHEAELQRAEALRESEAFSRGVLESSPDCVEVLDATGRLMSINANGAGLMEIDDFTSFVGRDWCDLWPEESRADVLAALGAARADGTARFQVFCPTAKGTAKWWDVIIAPSRNAHGEAVRFVAVSRDITKRVRDEQTLRQRTALFETLLNDAPLGAFLIDADFCVRAVNPTARQGFGDLPGLIGQHFAQAVLVEWPVELAEELVRRIGHTLQSGEPYTAHEYRVNRRDRGTVEHYDWQIHRIALPEGDYGVVCYYNDVSAQVRAVEIIAESEDRYRTLFESAPMAVFACDSDAVMQDYNARAAEIWGREPVRGIEKHSGSLRLLLPDGTLLPHAQSPIVDVLRTGEPAQNVEGIIERPDGSRLPILANFAALKNARGEITGAITSFMDITKIKRLESDLHRHATDLLEADRRKNEFLAMLAHELRNPLAPIRNALHIMRMTAGDERAVQTAAAMMERQVGQMVRLVDDLLDASRVSRGRIVLRKERIELAAAVNHAVEASRPLCESMSHRLELELPPRPIWVDADPTRLAQVVGNLLNNACKFTERGGCIRLSVEQDGKQAVIRVRDNGVGIAADELVRVFDLFVQVDTSLGRSVSGLGIGLTLVKSLVEVHGGSVHVLSAGIGQGSEFVVSLPMLAETLAAQLTEPVAGTPTIASARSILVVDDNRDAALSLATVLQLSGYTTHVAYDGAEAVQVAAAVRPDVMLLDIGLPKLDGYEVARKIRAQPWGEAMVLVALTGWGQEEDRRKSSEAGFDGHLVKPVDLDALMKLLAETLAVVLPD